MAKRPFSTHNMLEELMLSYKKVLDIYEEDMDSRMSEVCIEIILLQNRPEMPQDNTFFLTAISLLADCESCSNSKDEAEEIKAAMFWWTLYREECDGLIDELIKT